MCLPLSLSASRWQGAQKYQQIGPDAYLKLLQRAFQGVDVQKRTAFVILDINTGVGDSLDAYCQLKAGRIVGAK